jgi:hypothetical protein
VIDAKTRLNRIENSRLAHTRPKRTGKNDCFGNIRSIQQDPSDPIEAKLLYTRGPRAVRDKKVKVTLPATPWDHEPAKP